MSIEQATHVSARLGEMLGINPTRESFSSPSSEQLVAAQSQMLLGSLDSTTALDADSTGGLTLFLSVPDGNLISAQPVDAIGRGASATVDLLIGTNSQGTQKDAGAVIKASGIRRAWVD